MHSFAPFRGLNLSTRSSNSHGSRNALGDDFDSLRYVRASREILHPISGRSSSKIQQYMVSVHDFSVNKLGVSTSQTACLSALFSQLDAQVLHLAKIRIRKKQV